MRRALLLVAFLVSCREQLGPECRAFLKGHAAFCDQHPASAACEAGRTDALVERGEEVCSEAMQATSSALYRATGKSPWVKR